MNYIYILLRISLKNIENWNVISGFFWIKTSFLLGSKLYFQNIYERVAVGRKYPCTRRPRICLLWYFLQRVKILFCTKKFSFCTKRVMTVCHVFAPKYHNDFTPNWFYFAPNVFSEQLLFRTKITLRNTRKSLICTKFRQLYHLNCFDFAPNILLYHHYLAPKCIS